MPYVDIADKTTLDATKAVVDNIEIDTTSIESKVDTVDTVVDRIEIDTTSIESKVNTIDTVVDRIEADTTSIESKVDTIDTNVDDIEARLGLTDDTGGSSSAGTAMAKLNAVLAAGGGQLYPAFKRLEVDISAGQNDDLDIIDVTGAGRFLMLIPTETVTGNVNASYNFQVTLDSTIIATYPAASSAFFTADLPHCATFNALVSGYMLAYINNSATGNALLYSPLDFKSNFKIRINTGTAQAACKIYIIYALYE